MLEQDISLSGLGQPSPGNASDLELLRQLIGVQESTRLYRGSLGPFFVDSSLGSPPEKCTVARELVKRWLSEQLQSRPAFENPDAVSDFLKIHFAGREYESFVVLFLDAQNRLISVQELFSRDAHPDLGLSARDRQAALSQNAACVMFSHNHPSGVPQPSRADEALTQTLKAALALVDVRVLDHLVIAGNRSMSFAETGLL